MNINKLSACLASLVVLLSLALPAEAEVSIEEARAIARIYTASFDRYPKDDGLNFWINTYGSGSPIEEIAEKFSSSPEFLRKYGELTDRGFVAQLFRNVLGRNGAEGGIQFWLNTLSSGKSRGYVLSKFSESPENREKTADVFSGIRLGSDGRWVFEGGTPQVPDPSPEGLWIGSTDNNRSITGLVLDDGVYYFLYSSQNNPSQIAGVVQGSYSADESTLNSTNARDFNLEGLGILTARVSASFSTKSTFDGLIRYSNGAVNSFSSFYSNDYELIPSISELVGRFSGSVAFSGGVESVGLSIAGDGSISGSGASGCNFTGIIYPKTNGNAFDLSIQFGGFPCLFTNQNFEGIAYYERANRKLYAMAPNMERANSFVFVGGIIPTPQPNPTPVDNSVVKHTLVATGGLYVVDATGKKIGTLKSDSGSNVEINVNFEGIDNTYVLTLRSSQGFFSSNPVSYSNDLCDPSGSIYVQNKSDVFVGANGDFYIADPFSFGAVNGSASTYNPVEDYYGVGCKTYDAGWISYPALKTDLKISLPIRLSQ
ncbi:DUF4214 domain-containing protein [Pseudomonadota bacterium]